MAVVTQRTGLTSHAIRAWERRYGVVDPGRSAGGHRLYSDREVERLRLLHRLTIGGRQIGQLSALTDPELTALLSEDESAGLTAPGAAGPAADETVRLLEDAMEAVRTMDAESLDAILRRAALGLETIAFLEHLMTPLLTRIGDAWENQDVTPAHEHLASAVVRRVGGWLLDNLEPDGDAPVLVLATPSGDRHELGAMAAAIAAASAGWRVVYLGPDLPASDIAGAARDSEANAVALSLVFAGAGDPVREELLALRRLLPPAVPIMAGGAAAGLYRDELEAIGAVTVETLEQLRLRLMRQGT